ncbi:nitroreductase family protein [Selenihalanaerobacter shriftii]|uniref:Nitroreductase n=1 Tax=Selenihalanaerobacter shriftii TaxID=142842 RepID=A0A1T4QGR4_9FIRM|nr:nitroreductase family protein [Selenihalanaerobacter shriftii]SKA02681.1 Nitroreductase [Selenihalanaerobacter shriftii]
MEVKEAIQKRRSIRSFNQDKVSKEDIDQILEAGRLAPSGTNLQPWRFVVVESEEMRDRLKDCTLDFVAEAPVVIACCVDKNSIKNRKRRIVELHKAGAFKGTELEKIDTSKYKGKKMDEVEIKNYLYLNCTIAIEHMILQATELGLGSCWIMMFNKTKTRELLELDNNLELVSLIPIGYYDENPAPRPRLSLDEIVVDRV